MHPQSNQTDTLNNPRPLTELKGMERATIHDLRGGVGFRSRLAALGFTPGVQITMLQNLGHGPIIVTLRDTRIALGRGEACKILIAPEKREQ
jgi:ferrous iron transport protein A